MKLASLGIGLLVSLPLLAGCSNDAGAANPPVVSETVATEPAAVEEETKEPDFPMPEPDAEIYVNPTDVIAEWASRQDLENPVMRFNADGTGQFLREFDVPDALSLERLSIVSGNNNLMRGDAGLSVEEVRTVIEPGTRFTWYENGTLRDANGGFWRFYIHNQGHLGLFYRISLLEPITEGTWSVYLPESPERSAQTWELETYTVGDALGFYWMVSPGDGSRGGGTGSGIFPVTRLHFLAESHRESDISLFIEPDGKLGVYTDLIFDDVNFRFLVPTEEIEQREVGSNLVLGDQIEISGAEIHFSDAHFGITSQSESEELRRWGARNFEPGDPWLQVAIGVIRWGSPQFIAPDGTVIDSHSLFWGENFIFNLAGIENPQLGSVRLRINNEYAIFILNGATESGDGINWPVFD